MKLFRLSLLTALVLASLGAYAATTLNVKLTGTPGVDCDYNDFAAALTAVNAGSGDYILNFTDAAPATYNYGYVTAASHNLTLTAAAPHIVTLNGRLDSAQGGTRLTATNITFSSTDAQWAAVVTYDGCTLTSCTFSNITAGHGIVMNGGGTNTLTGCAFTLVTYNAVASAAGNTTLNNCTWNDVGVMIYTESTNAGYTLTVNGGTYSPGSRVKTNNGMRPTGGPAIVINDMLLDGLNVAVQHDWITGVAALTFNRCTIQGTLDSLMQYHGTTNAAYSSTLVANDCTFVLTPNGPVGLALNPGGTNVAMNTFTFNRCLFKRAASAKTGWMFYTPDGYVTVNVKNCIFDGCDHALVNQATGTAVPSTFNVDYCTFVNSNSSLFSQGSSTVLNVTNSIFDVSTLYAFDTNGSTVNANNNLINSSSGSYTFGTNRYTGSPAFVNLAGGNYRLGTASVAIGKGLATSLTADYYSQTRPMPFASAPDLGAAEEQTITTGMIIKKTGTAGVDCNFTELSAALAAVNADDNHTSFTLYFIDAAPASYAIGNPTAVDAGKTLTFVPTNGAGLVTVDGRLDMMGGGGKLYASNVTFMSSGGVWGLIVGYDGFILTNCTIGPNADNGIVANGGGTNTFTNCTFTRVTSAAVSSSAGNTTFENCSWNDIGRMFDTNGGSGSSAYTLTVNGGTFSAGSRTKDNYGFRPTGYPRVVVNNFSFDGVNVAIQHDWLAGPADVTLNNCTITNTLDSSIQWRSGSTASYTSTLTANDCRFLFNTAGGATCFNLDTLSGAAALNTLNFNRCLFKRAAKTNWCFYAKNGFTTVNCKTSVFDGFDHPVLTDNTQGATPATFNMDYCTFVNSNAVFYCQQSSGVVIGVTNSIFDASCSYAFDTAGNPNVTPDNNLINTSSALQGTNAYTGTPDFVNLAGGDYHIGPSSTAIRKGLTTSLTQDYYGQARPMPALTQPDLGAAEEQVVPVELSSFNVE